MRCKGAVLLLLLLLLSAGVSAETFDGTLTSTDKLLVTAGDSAAVEQICIRAGETVSAGQPLLYWKTIPVFAPRNGTIALVSRKEGEKADGSVVEILPEERYTVYCTTDGAYKEPERQNIHAGEYVYIKCTKDGTHRAVGIITQPEGDQYTVEVTGGELFVGETVWIFRDRKMSNTERIGKGTAVSADHEIMTTNGYIFDMKVQQGDAVSRGQLLYRYLTMDNKAVTADCEMLITDVCINPGDTVQKEQKLLEGVTADRIRIAFDAEEDQIGLLYVNMPVWLSYGFDPEERLYPGKVESIVYQEDTQNWKVRVIPSDPPLMLGATVQIRTEP